MEEKTTFQTNFDNKWPLACACTSLYVFIRQVFFVMGGVCLGAVVFLGGCCFFLGGGFWGVKN